MRDTIGKILLEDGGLGHRQGQQGNSRCGAIQGTDFPLEPLEGTGPAGPAKLFFFNFSPVILTSDLLSTNCKVIHVC